jgi:cytosine/adenosine deaminase-related metal-dependent hydrolase
MCILCRHGKPHAHSTSRRNFLKGTAATGLAAGAMGLFGAQAEATGDGPPRDSGRPGRRYVIRNGFVMTMEPGTPGQDSPFGEFIEGDVLVEGKKIKAIGKNLSVGNAAEIDARGKVVMPGFIDTHHHQAWTAIRSSIPDSILIDDGTGTASAEQNYFFNILGALQPTLPGFANHFRPRDVYISELFGGLSQLDAGVTTVLDISQIHHSPEHSDAAVKALRDTGRRAMLGFFESAGNIAGNQYPADAPRLAGNLAGDDLVGFVMGGEVYLGNATTRQSWTIGRQLGVLVAAHILSPFGIRPLLDQLTGVSPDVPDFTGETLEGIEIGEDNLFIHMTGMSDPAWQRVKDVGAKVSIAFPIEMNMRHGQPPILKMQSFNSPAFEPSLSTDVETNMTADFFTQMRSAMTMQRMVANQAVLDSGPIPVNPWPPYPAGLPPLLNARDVLRFATINGAKHLRLDSKTGSLKVNKEADIIILDGSHLNVFPMNNVPGAVVTMMERTNVETVIVAGKIRKWKGRLLDVNLDLLRPQLLATRNFLYNAVGRTPNPFPAK